MSTTANTKAIVLQYTPWQEYDRLYTLYTERFGKVRLRAHGVQKIQSKLAGSLEPFAEIDLFFIQAKTLNKIGGAVVVQRFANTMQSLESQHAAWYCVEIINRLTEEDETDPELYQLLYSILTWIDHRGPQQAVIRAFALKVIRHLGYDVASETNDPDVRKCIQWCYTQPFSEIQKLRFTEVQWKHLLQAINTWFYSHGNSHIQAEKFLV